ncbi:MAG TPA: tryptophan--tRNA ligase [Candidatus Paceibacterota bacterium]
MSKGILVSGVKPTGTLHIGNYFGALKQFVAFQNEYECRFFVANLHALTSVRDAQKMKEQTLDVVLDFLAVGIDPSKAAIYLQSDVPHVAELAWIFECLTSVPYLSRAHAFKDAEAKKKEVNAGTFNYPMLMAADILAHDANVVPVGADQKQHLEIAQDVAEKFNNTFGETFARPEALIIETVATVPGTDGQKMSKSHNNIIPLFATNEEIEKAVMGIPTDSKGVNEPKDSEKDTVFKLHTLVTPSAQLEDLRARYEDGKIGYKESKEILIDSLKKFIGPLREKRAEWAGKEREVEKIIREGGERMRKVVHEKMIEVRGKVGLIHHS